MAYARDTFRMIRYANSEMPEAPPFAVLAFWRTGQGDGSEPAATIPMGTLPLKEEQVRGVVSEFVNGTLTIAAMRELMEILLEATDES